MNQSHDTQTDIAPNLSHFNEKGQAHMVDIHDKNITHRVAIAVGTIYIQPETRALIDSKGTKKGDVLGVARIAGIMAAKRTSDLIPLCHPLMISHISVDFELNTDPSSITCIARVETIGKTGVEMEALIATQIGLLTIYDMCKAVDKTMCINNIHLKQKTGGRSTTVV